MTGRPSGSKEMRMDLEQIQEILDNVDMPLHIVTRCKEDLMNLFGKCGTAKPSQKGDPPYVAMQRQVYAPRHMIEVLCVSCVYL